QPGQGIPNGLEYERINVYVVECINKDPAYIYGKRVWYVDPESYLILYSDIYDENARYWKCFMNMTAPVKTIAGDAKMFITGTVFPDFNRTHSGLSNQQHFYEPKIGDPKATAKIFTISNLQKTY
ncbi:MAG: DUF1329 domain-containing protein, partial [Deltaproteobacteria bacterium]|nr:DUF1329 domain-containing protein [Deltaproteobacteria bacterium]